MAFGPSRGHSRGGRPGMGGKSVLGGRGGSGGGFGGPTFSRPPRPMGPSSFGAPIAPPPPVNINIGSSSRRHSRGGGNGLMSSLLSSAVSAGVGVASAAIVNKIHENSQIKIAEKQAEQQAEYARQQAEQQAEYARQQAEYQVEIEKLKAKQEETKLDAMQDKRYYSNCPYCMGVNNGAKFCQYCGSSLAYYDTDDSDENDKSVNNQQN